MTPLAIALVTTAAGLHAFWNLLGKRQNPSGSFFWIASLAGGLCLLPLGVYWRHSLAAIPLSIWVLMAASGLFETLYYVCLAGAYRSGDMSVAYPLARALPTVMITLVSIVLHIGKPLTATGMVGIAAVAAGCLMVPMHSFSELRLSNYRNACCALAFTAAIGTTGYTLVDNEALRQLRSLPSLGLSNTVITLLYLLLTTAVIVAFVAVYILLYRPEQARLRGIVATTPVYAIIAGLTITVGYAMVLTSMAYASNISYIGAFRQVSIPLGAALGIVVQKEKLYAPKVIGTATVLAGLVLVALA